MPRPANTVSSRYLVGVDLGTTNSACAWVDTRQPLRGGRPVVHRFAIPQIVHPGEVAPRDTLPSFLYFPTEQEADAGISPKVRWSDGPKAIDAGLPTFGRSDPPTAVDRAIVGVYARDHGALVPGRQVSSAKSWLCNPAVDRTAPILPWGHSDEDAACSPVAASARYLAHIRDAWNGIHARADRAARFEAQSIVLTVPASFDEEARELTVQAAREAGLEQVTLLEEPLAAFYAWLASHAGSFRRQLRNGDTILICDVGGGTTDFTLIRTTFEDDEVRFERTAIGEHLLLGGDNLDLALAKRLEAGLGHVRLTLRQQQALARLTSAAKEDLLGAATSGVGRRDRATIAIPAAGRALVGGRLAAELTRDEVVATLREGFLPRVSRSDVPARAMRAGLREFGLPYATEPAITRHLAAFLARAAVSGPGGVRGSQASARPDAVLFNGGFFTPDVARETIVETLQSWFEVEDSGWQLKVLSNRNPTTAVAVGAAHYAFVRLHGGVRVSGGSARAYYIGLAETHASSDVRRPTSDVRRPRSEVRSPEPEAEGAQTTPDTGRVRAVCVMPRGTDEGTTLDLPGRAFVVATNRPIALPLYSATTRHDRLGDLVELDTADAHEHAPLVTILRYGKKSRQTELPVHLSARFTEVGTLELWCHSDISEHRWRLQFELRATEHAIDEDEEEATTERASEGDGAGIVIADDAIEQASGLIRGLFQGSAVESGRHPLGPRPGDVTAETLVARIEALAGYARQAWPLAVIRRLGDGLLDVADGRRKGPQFEARWLNLTGFCLRPGFGATLDDWRMERLRRIYLAGLAFPNELQGQAEWFVLWQRVAGGLSAGQQQELVQRYRAQFGVGGKKETKRINPQVEREGWRLLASLEWLPAPVRTSLGNELLGRAARHPDNPAFLWSLGRLGARIPSYGPLNTIVPAGAVTAWLEILLSRPRLSADAQAAVVQMAARTDDPHRDIDEALRARVVDRLTAAGAPSDDLERVLSYVPPATADAIRMFGETLPAGLRVTDAE